MWPLIAMAGFGMLGQMQQNKSAAKASLQEARAVSEANTKNFHRTLFQIGMLQVQQADEKRTLAQRKADLGAQELQSAGVAANNAAASGTIGASIDAVQSDVQAQFDRARAEISEENERNIETFNMQLQDVILSGQNSLQSIKKPRTASPTDMLLNTALSVGSMYATQRMNLGLGQGN
jgi:hypothetical protein